MIAKKCIVKGKVQGVFFRGMTASRAEELGITGSAINLPNGDVQIIAAGEEASMNSFTQWLHEGPRLATVTSVSCEPFEGKLPDEFTIG